MQESQQTLAHLQAQLSDAQDEVACLTAANEELTESVAQGVCALSGEAHGLRVLHV